MEPSSSSSKRIKVESKPMDSDQQLVGSNLLDDETSSNSSVSLNDRRVKRRSDPRLYFETLRWSSTFVDKSMLLRCVMEDEEHRVLLTAPPRFGKTMACNMLKVFFQIANSEEELKEKYNLFKDLRIYKSSESCTDKHDCKRFIDEHFGKHPVISLDFAVLSTTTYSSFLEGLRNMISKQFEKYRCLIQMGDKTYSWSSNHMQELDVDDFLNYLKPACKDNHWKEAEEKKKADEYIFEAFRYLIKVVSVYYENITERNIIILIDEFDAPFMKLLFRDHPDKEIITLIQDLMRLLCKEDTIAKLVERVTIFSVTALGGIMSLGANNVERRTFLDKNYDYYKFFGFTKEEVIALVEKTLPESQQQKALDEIFIWYNNYTVIGHDTTICNPMSVTNYLAKLERKSYWSDKVGTNCVCKLFKFEKMREKLFPAIRENQNISINTTTIQLDDISCLKDLHDSILNCITQEQVDLALQFLTECGYFNVTHKDDRTWTLQIPNQELKEIFSDKLYNVLLNVKTNLFNVNQQESFVNALKALGCGKEHEPAQYVTFKESVQKLYPNRELLPKAHFHFHCDLWMLISCSGKLTCDSELPIKKGWSPRLDLIIITECAAIIIEVKRNKQDSAEKALEQCIEKKYYEIFKSMENEIKGLKKILMGLHLADDGTVSIRYLENFDPNRETSIKEIVEKSYTCSDLKTV